MIVEKKINTGEVEINYAEGPDSGPPLLLLHGNSWRWQSFLSIIPVLSQRWHVFAPDFRGHGNSGRVPESYALDNYLDDTSFFIENLIKEPVIIFGHSMGGAVSFLVASQKPERVKGLIIGDMMLQKSVLEKQIQSEQILNMLKQWIEWADLEATNLDLLQILLEHPIKIPEKEESIPWSEVPNSIPWLLFLAQNLSKLDPNTQQGWLSLSLFRENWKLYDYKIFLPKIKCPVLLLQADAKLGGLMSDSCIKLAQEHIDYLIPVRLENIGHALFHQKSEPILQILIDFLEMIRE